MVNKAADTEPGLLSPRRQLWLVLVLSLTVVLAFADRSVLAILVDPIKTDLGIDDVRMSLLMGLSFSFVYALAALPFGALTDTVNRSRMIAIAVACWSAMTIVCGFAQSYTQLVIGRMGLGVAEAALAPIGFSLIRDAVALNKRGRALAAFNSCHNIGTGAALTGGGALLGFYSAGGAEGLPLLGALQPWQLVLLSVGIIGFPLALLILTIREPARSHTVTRSSASYASALAFVARNKRIMLPYWFGIALLGMAQGGISAWTAMAVHRLWDVPIPKIGAVMGPVQIATALVAAFTWGTLIDRSARAGKIDAPFRVGIFALTLSALAVISQLFITSLTIAVGVYVVQIFCFGVFMTSATAGLATIVPSDQAGKLSALSGLFTTLLGLGSGPTVVALASQSAGKGPAALHDCLVIVAAAGMIGGLIMYVLTAAAVRRRGATVHARAGDASVDTP